MEVINGSPFFLNKSIDGDIFPVTNDDCVLRSNTNETLEDILLGKIKISDIDDTKILELFPDIEEIISYLENILLDPENNGVNIFDKLSNIESSMDNTILSIQCLNEQLDIIENEIKDGE